MNYLVIDLEMCGVPKLYQTGEYPYSTEVIQIGAVMLDEEYAITGELNQYVHPEHGVLDRYIEALTGIHRENLKNAPDIRSAIGHLLDWIGGRECRIYAWSKSDYVQLKRELSLKDIDSDRLKNFMKPRKWVDYQKIFDKRFRQTKPTSLKNALSLMGIIPEGRFHNGMDDAKNTALLIGKLEKTPPMQELYAPDVSREDISAEISFVRYFGGQEILLPF